MTELMRQHHGFRHCFVCTLVVTVECTHCILYREDTMLTADSFVTVYRPLALRVPGARGLNCTYLTVMTGHVIRHLTEFVRMCNSKLYQINLLFRFETTSKRWFRTTRLIPDQVPE